ncbi:MAG: lytic murein transglycosylase [Rhizobiales bacterium]|nr:lytic murein transglycosylase [Hyphomicrobiales bacterium]
MRRARHLIATVLIGVLMSGEARAEASFDGWVRDFWPVAQAEGISRATYENAFRGVTPDPEVLEKAQFQPEFVKPMWDYVRNAASEKRVATGRDMLAQHGALLDRIEAAYGVDRHILVAIWGMESSYGEVLSDPKIVRSVVRSLATLAWGDKRRARFGRQQLLAALKIVERGDIAIDGLTGSWAGAMGHTQFIPTTYQAYAVDFDGDGRRDMWNSPVDALASAGNYLNKSGWVGGKTWGYEVVLPTDFDYRLADVETSHALGEWERLGVRRAGGEGFPRPEDKGVLLAPAGASGPAFLLLRNHYVIKRYNNATAYALGVGHLADQLRGGGAFVQAWPSSERPLSREETAELQGHLIRVGLYQGAIDGKIGPRSRAAIRAFQSGRGLKADGFAGVRLLEALRSG